jgi:hypothetical protein
MYLGPHRKLPVTQTKLSIEGSKNWLRWPKEAWAHARRTSIGTSTTTLTSSVGLKPIALASRRMVAGPGRQVGIVRVALHSPEKQLRIDIEKSLPISGPNAELAEYCHSSAPPRPRLRRDAMLAVAYPPGVR